MAVSRSSGYGNLPNDNFIPQIFSQKVQKFFRRASVVEDITNTDYAGEIENFGDTVKIIKEPMDVHSGNVARKLGLIDRKQNDLKALMELDENLRKLDATDPVKYDFALFGLGVFEKF